MRLYSIKGLRMTFVVWKVSYLQYYDLRFYFLKIIYVKIVVVLIDLELIFCGHLKFCSNVFVEL